MTACGGSSKTPGTHSSTAGGGESTSQVCSELTTQAQALVTTLIGSLGSLPSDPTALASAGPQVLSSAKTALTQLVGILHTEAGKASDSKLRDALNTAADQLNTAIGNINSIADLQSLPADMSSISQLDSFCPNAIGE
jgi:hypothetical protein